MTNSNWGEVVGKERQNVPHYVTMDVRQPVGNRHAAKLLWGSLAESYAEGGHELHIHFLAGLVNGGIAGDWCAIFNRAEDWLDFVSSEAFNPEREARGSKKRNVRQPVLVLDGKLVELPKGVVGGPVPSVVRLQPLDNCFRAWVDAPKHVIEFGRILFEEGWEPRFSFDAARHWPALAGDGEFKDEVVEGGTQVVDTVADDEAKFIGGRRLENFDPKELLGAINIGFTPSSVRAFFSPSVQFGFKALQVVERSAEPPFVVEGHGV